MHRPFWFLLAHAVHHESRPPTAWAAMSFHPLEALTGAVAIPALVFLIPIHIGGLAMVLMIMTIMGITNHMGWEIFPKFMVNRTLGSFLITATHHQKHHDKYRGNYGLYFRFWDKVCGTDLGLGHFGHESGNGRPDGISSNGS
jgi:sterol desaturase/sphingolipid hydroxylase (fatty acid hydroxylase superfamily)